MKRLLWNYNRPLRFIFDSFRWHKWVLYLFFAGKIIEAIFYIVFPILAKLEMDQLVEKNEQLFGIIELSSLNIFLVILAIIFLMKLIENILRSLVDLFEFKYVKILENAYELNLYKRLAHLEIWLYLNNRNKRMFWNVLDNSYEIRNLINRYIWDFISNIITFVWILLVISLFNIYIFIVLIISSILIYYLQKYKEYYTLKNEISQNFEFEYKLNRLKHEVGENLHLLSANSGFWLLLSSMKRNNQDSLDLVYKEQKRDTIVSILTFWVENGAELIFKVIIGYAIFIWTESVGFMSMALLYISRLDSIFRNLYEFRFDWNHMLDVLKKLDLFLDFTEEKNIGSQISRNFSSIYVKNLNFTYPNVSEKELQYFDILEKRILSYKGERDSYDEDDLFMINEAREQLKVKNPQILDNINLELEKWKIYGLVWKNWAGKTTFIQLLLWYFGNYWWEILIWSTDVKNISKWSLYDNISIINQVPYVLVDFSVKENLLLWVEKKYSDEYIMELLHKFWLGKKIKSLRLWLDSKIWYDSDFSWWEKQIMVLIRNILQDKPILIMDEWTNQLDAENELLVMEELLRNRKNKIIIFVTHRMTSIRKADKIFCLENGKITHAGTHQELLLWENIYRKFWEKQVIY